MCGSSVLHLGRTATLTTSGPCTRLRGSTVRLTAKRRAAIVTLGTGGNGDGRGITCGGQPPTHAEKQRASFS